MYEPRVSESTVPDATTSILPEASVAVAPELDVTMSYGTPNSAVAGFAPKIVITGAVVSTTFTVLVAVPTFPEASVAV